MPKYFMLRENCNFFATFVNMFLTEKVANLCSDFYAVKLENTIFVL
jgi:hypothetical protein